MVDVSSQNNSVSINVSSGGNSASIKATPDTAQYYSEKAREWAISNRIVDGVDYSSKYYALNAQSYAQSALETLNNVDSKVQEATDNIEIQKQDVITEIENLSEQEQSKIIDLGIDTRANVDLSNLSEVGEKHFLGKSQITNCITEIPQNIKLDLADGVLTLKAGSKVIIPNGFEEDGTTPKFDEVMVESDIAATSFNGNNTVYQFYSANNNIAYSRTDAQVFSGSTAPTSNRYMFWYDTTNNVIKSTSDTGATWITAGWSLPISRAVTTSDGAYTSIDQIFNGMGYLGSTIWVDKGVKVLIANGRNGNGTLNNIEAITDKVVTKTVASTTNAPNHYIMIGQDGGIYGPTTIQAQYDEVLNINTYQDNVRTWTIVGYIDITNGVMSNLRIKNIFRVADYQEVVKKSGDTMTGSLISEQSSYFNFVAKSTVIDATATPASTQYVGIDFKDKNDVRLGWFGICHDKSGATYANLVNLSGGSDGFMFPRCTTKATTTSTASNYKVAVVVQNYVNGTSWYRVWSDGWKEQGGTLTPGVYNNPSKITFLKAFSNVNYSIAGTVARTSTEAGNFTETVNFKAKTASSIKVSTGGNGNAAISYMASWYACGY